VPWTSLIRVTIAPGTTPPDESMTRPVRLPVVTCADAESASRNKATTRPTKNLLRAARIILPSPLCSAVYAKTPTPSFRIAAGVPLEAKLPYECHPEKRLTNSVRVKSVLSTSKRLEKLQHPNPNDPWDS